MPDIYVSTDNEKKEEIQATIAAMGSTKNPLRAFITNPRGVHFGIQEKDEEIILLLRKHWITNVPWILTCLVLFFAPLVLRFFPLIDFLPTRYQLMSIVMWYLLITAFVFEQFLTWFFNVYIVTNKRLVDVDFYNLIYLQVVEAETDKVQDITSRIGGVIRSLFNYGDVLVQTAGALPNLEFEAVPHPDQVARILNELRG